MNKKAIHNCLKIISTSVIISLCFINSSQATDNTVDFSDLNLVLKEIKVPLKVHVGEKAIEKFKYFNKVRKIGTGTEGVIYEMNFNNSNKNIAVKICKKCKPVRNKLLYFASYVLYNEISPHIIDIFDLFEIWPNKFFYQTLKFDNSSYNQLHVIVEELCDGDLQKFYKNYNSCSDEKICLDDLKVIHQIQISSIVNSLYDMFNIIDQDVKNFKGALKDFNIFYKTIDSKDTFRGERFSDYKYWHYRVDGVDYYIPSLNHIIKLGDFGYWESGYDPTRMGIKKLIQPRLRNKLINTIDKSKAKKFTIKPTEDVKILDLTNNDSELKLKIL